MEGMENQEAQLDDDILRVSSSHSIDDAEDITLVVTTASTTHEISVLTTDDVLDTICTKLGFKSSQTFRVSLGGYEISEGSFADNGAENGARVDVQANPCRKSTPSPHGGLSSRLRQELLNTTAAT